MALSEKFRWVEVNRDHVPALPKQFNVSAYPTLLVIGGAQEKIYRFQSFMPPNEFVTHLREGLRRYDLYRNGKEWDARPPRPATICDGADVQTLKAPSEEQPGGAAMLGGKLYVAQGSELHCVDLTSGRTEKSYHLPRPARGLAAHDGLVFAVDYGWTAGKPIYVFDPRRGEVVREIVTEANKKNRSMSASGIVWAQGKLFVLSRSNVLSEVDPQTGDVVQTRRLPQRSWKLAFDGTNLVTATHVVEKQQALQFVDPRTLQVAHTVKLNYGVSAIACHRGALLLMEQPVRGFGKHHERVRIWPDQMLIHQVRLREPGKAAAQPGPPPAKTRPAKTTPAKKVVYKRIGGVELRLHVFEPPGHKASDRCAAIVFFFGGGWVSGSPRQFHPHCTHLARRGMVAISAEYRVRKRHGTTPFDCVADGKSAIRYVRSNARAMGIDPQRIGAGGGSAGGHVAAAVATVDGFEDPGHTVRSTPDALVLFNPVYDNGPGGYGYDRVKTRFREISPLHNIHKGVPPAITFLGTKDKLVPVATAKKFQAAMRKVGSRSELELYDGRGHGFFNHGRGDGKDYADTVRKMDAFLKSLGWLE